MARSGSTTTTARLAIAAGSIIVITAAAAMADETRTVSLVPAKGVPIQVAELTIAENGHYQITWDDTKFDDFFLSMRPFKCLEGPEKLWCRVDYPYQNQRSIAGDDLTDLEYDLLFVWKNAKDYGIDMWNGVYYDLAGQDGRLVGTMNEMDMDVLAAPPEDGSLRPIQPDMLDEADADSHWLPKLIIE